MTTKRLDNTLTSLANQYVPDALMRAPHDLEKRVPYLADSLVRVGILVMTADIPSNNYQFLLRRWTYGYRQIYDVLASNLFTTLLRIDLGTVDNMTPPVVVLKGQAVPVIDVLAGYVVPYVTLRQQTSTLNEPEIRGIITIMLDELDDEISTQVSKVILQTCTRVIRELVNLPITQYSLTSMKKPLFQQTYESPPPPKKRPRPAPDRKRDRNQPPPSLPEDPASANGTHDINLSSNNETTQPMPIWFDEDEDSGYQPPVPPLDDEDDT